MLQYVNPTITKKGKNKDELVQTVNPAWTNNSKILESVRDALVANRFQLASLVPDFELAVLGNAAKSEKPYNA